MTPEYIFHHLLLRLGKENGGAHVFAQMRGILESPGLVSDQ